MSLTWMVQLDRQCQWHCQCWQPVSEVLRFDFYQIEFNCGVIGCVLQEKKRFSECFHYSTWGFFIPLGDPRPTEITQWHWQSVTDLLTWHWFWVTYLTKLCLQLEIEVVCSAVFSYSHGIAEKIGHQHEIQVHDEIWGERVVCLSAPEIDDIEQKCHYNTLNLCGCPFGKTRRWKSFPEVAVWLKWWAGRRQEICFCLKTDLAQNQSKLQTASLANEDLACQWELTEAKKQMQEHTIWDESHV